MKKSTMLILQRKSIGRFTKASIITLLSLYLILGSVQAAHAEETPTLVPLSYIINLSNTGATTATGNAYVWRTEAEVRLHVDGMTVLPAKQKYACWLVDQQAGKFLSVGRFTVSAAGSATLDVTLPGSIPTNYTSVLITVQPEPDATPTVPSQLYSIAGFISGNVAIQKQVKQLPTTSSFINQTPAPTQPQNLFSWFVYAPLVLAAASFIFLLRRQRIKQR